MRRMNVPVLGPEDPGGQVNSSHLNSISIIHLFDYLF